MPLQSITHAASRTTKLDGEITPADLPSGRVRFSDELGRETALVSRRDPPPARRADDVASDESAHETHGGDEAAVPQPPRRDTEGATTRSSAATRPTAPRTTTRATRAPPGSEREKAAPAPGGEDEIALTLAELGLAVPAPPTPPIEPAPALDLSGTRIVASGALAAATADPASSSSAGDAATLASLNDRGDRGAAELAAALLAPAETEAARDVAPESKVTRDIVAKDTKDAKAASDVARLLAVATAPHASADPARASADGPSAAKSAAAAPSEPPAPPAAEAAPRVPLADLPHALPALLDEAGPRLSFGRRGATWEVELRLDPPELGSLRIRFELHGETIRGAIQCEPRVERMLGPVLKELEEGLGRQGANGSFDLARQARDEEGRAPASRSPQSTAAAAAAPASRAPSARNDPSRLVDVTA